MCRLKVIIVLTGVLIFSSSLFAFRQNSGEVQRITAQEYHPKPNTNTSIRDADAILSLLNGIEPTTNFGAWSGDYLMQYFVPPADGHINSIDFNFSDRFDVSGGGMEIWICESSYPWPEINTEAIADIQGDAHLGYYAEATGFEAFGSNWVSGGINNIAGAFTWYDYDPLGLQVWPDTGSAYLSIEPSPDDYGWVNLDLVATSGSNYDFTLGVPFIVVVRFNGFETQGSDEASRAGFYAAAVHTEPQPSLKFYGENGYPAGRTGINDWGWYIRSYVYDWDVNVTLTSDRGPVISNWTQLDNTVDQSPRMVTAEISDDNPDEGAFGVASADVMVSAGGGTYTPIVLTETVAGTWTGDIPGFSEGGVDYYFTATDVNGLTTTTLPFHYGIFVPTAPTLVVFNGGTVNVNTYPQAYYFGQGDFVGYSVMDFPHDVWNDAISPGIASAYTTIYEFGIYRNQPPDDNKEVIEAWLAEGAKNYLIAGDEIFGHWTEWIDRNYTSGDFEYDILGVAHIYNDINADPNEADAIEAIPENILTGNLYTEHHAVFDMLLYDPVYELGDGAQNWLDGFTPVNAADVNMTTYNRSADLAIGLNRVVGDDKIVVLGFDPLSINASPYTWWGFSEYSAQTKSLEWFGITTPAIIFPAAPQNLSELSYDDSVQLAWDAGSESNLWYYTIFRANDFNPLHADSIASVIHADHMFTDTTVDIGTIYRYWVTAVDSSGYSSGYSNGVSSSLPVHAVDGSAYLHEYSRIRVIDDAPIYPEANPGALAITGNTLTVEAWVFPTGLPPDGEVFPIVVRPYLNQTPERAYELRITNEWGDGSWFQFALTDGSTIQNSAWLMSTSNVEEGAWTHIAGTYDGTWRDSISTASWRVRQPSARILAQETLDSILVVSSNPNSRVL